MKQLRWLFIIVAGLTGFSAQADTDAVTVHSTTAGGYVLGGAGFTFAPAGRLNGTRLAYLATGQQNPIIRFWSDTNVIASYTMSTSAVVEMVYRPVSLTSSV